jgi:hypothetical protein
MYNQLFEYIYDNIKQLKINLTCYCQLQTFKWRKALERNLLKE